MQRILVINAAGHFRAPDRILLQAQMKQKRRQLILLLRWQFDHRPH
jgi:hypothetical protein